MKTILFLALTAFGVHTAWAQQWVEYKRTVKKNESLSFTDTMYIYSLDKKNASLRIGGFLYNTEVKDGTIGLAFGNFKIISQDKNEIVLEKNASSKHYFQKRAKAAPIVVPVDNIAEEIKNGKQTPIEIHQPYLIGKWTAYKRENRSGPSGTLDFNKLIKIAQFETQEEGGFKGTMKLGSEATYLYEVQGVADGKFQTKTPQGQDVLMHIYRLTERELIFEDGAGIIYYMRK